MSHCTYQKPVMQEYNSFFDVDVGSSCSVKLTHSSAISDAPRIFRYSFRLIMFRLSRKSVNVCSLSRQRSKS